jgi:hypothetical protein
VRSVVLLVLLATAPAVWCQTAGQDERSALDVIDDCSGSAHEDTYGLTDLESECPGLTRALEEARYLPLLSAAVRDQLDVSQLSDLLTVDDWYHQQEARDIDVGTLGPVLDSLRAQEPERPVGWWQRFMRWLRALLERRQGDPDNWLSRWLDDLDVSEAIARTILIAAMVLLIGVAIAVLLNELRVAGILRQRPVVRDPAVDVAASGVASGDVTNLDALSADRKAPLLLRMLVATLVRSGRLRTERSLTYRELCTRATFDDTQQLDCFRRVAALAERTVYGNDEVSAEEVEPVVAAARALDAQLRGVPA